MAASQFTPGSLIRARGREWIVLTGSNAETLRVRPISGSEEDRATIHLALEPEPPTEATFPRPVAHQQAGHDAALLLRDALLLSLRRGAGPFRSFGQIGVEPRAYQLVPLLMALKQETVRLLIADDVGIGKTIEAALIAREFLDRGEIERIAVLCPPHLVEQWIGELENRFHIRAAAVTAASASRLERGLPLGDSIFRAYPFTVVSLDYIKTPKRREEFLRACPEFVIVDEAHTCTSMGAGHHQRYELLKGLATSTPARHLVLLTATPHSGDDSAFHRLLGLLRPEFEGFEDKQGEERAKLREELSHYFVQRRRPDIAEWREGNLFPERKNAELTYKLTGAWDQFFDNVLKYCATVIEKAGGDERRQRMSFWGTLALMRCVASSPAAAAQALRTRATVGNEEADEELLADKVFDGTNDALPDDDVEPSVAADPALAKLIEQAEQLAGQAGDPKLKLLTDHVEHLVKDGFSPVVFCRFIATAHYVAANLRERLKGVTVEAVTGELTSDERREKVEVLGDAEKRVLVATDCLSEGINLQEHHDAVVHYDLSWNPTRHEQREGRVDRFGQEKAIVRATLIYGANNPVDGAVLEVILRKAARIREELGVPVPLPDEGHTLTNALMRAVLLHGGRVRQEMFDFASLGESKAIEVVWKSAREQAKKNTTVFAQRRLKPADVLPEWEKTRAALGGAEDVKRFTDRALQRLGAGLERMNRGYKVALAALPEDVRERLGAEGLEGAPLIDFKYPPAPRCRAVQRSHPLVSVLADALLERTLTKSTVDKEAGGDPGCLGRVGCWVTAGVTEQTTVALLRLRHQLTTQKTKGATANLALVEEAAALVWRGVNKPTLVEGAEALALLTLQPSGELKEAVRTKFATQALEVLAGRTEELEAFAQRRADALLADHRRVRSAAEARGQYAVKALLPPDVIGLFVLLPKVG